MFIDPKTKDLSCTWFWILLVCGQVSVVEGVVWRQVEESERRTQDSPSSSPGVHCGTSLKKTLLRLEISRCLKSVRPPLRGDREGSR